MAGLTREQRKAKAERIRLFQEAEARELAAAPPVPESISGPANGGGDATGASGEPVTAAGVTPRPTLPAGKPSIHLGRDGLPPNPLDEHVVRKMEEEMSKSPFDIHELDVEQMVKGQHETNKKRSLDAIEQAVKDAQALAEEKVRTSPETRALAANPGDLKLRDAFLKRFGPTAVKPPRPKYAKSDPRSKMGYLDEGIIRWEFTYNRENAVKIYANRHDELIESLMEEARAILSGNQAAA